MVEGKCIAIPDDQRDKMHGVQQADAPSSSIHPLASYMLQTEGCCMIGKRKLLVFCED